MTVILKGVAWEKARRDNADWLKNKVDHEVKRVQSACPLLCVGNIIRLSRPAKFILGGIVFSKYGTIIIVFLSVFLFPQQKVHQ